MSNLQKLEELTENAIKALKELKDFGEGEIENNYRTQDKEVTNIYHILEFGVLSASQYTKVAYKLKKELINRRSYKECKYFYQRLNVEQLYNKLKTGMEQHKKATKEREERYKLETVEKVKDYLSKL